MKPNFSIDSEGETRATLSLNEDGEPALDLMDAEGNAI
jgi:hypothetical protein